MSMLMLHAGFTMRVYLDTHLLDLEYVHVVLEEYRIFFLVCANMPNVDLRS